MILWLPVRNYGDLARLVYQFAESGGNVMPLVEHLEGPGCDKRWARQFVESMLASFPDFAASQHQVFVSGEVSQLVRMAVVDPSFPQRLEAGLKHAARFMKSLKGRNGEPLDLLHIASITKGA